MTGSTRKHVTRSLRVAAAATLIVGLVSLVAVLVLDITISHRLVGQADSRIGQRLDEVRDNPASSAVAIGTSGNAASTPNTDPDDAPVFTWLVSPAGHVESSTPGAPALPVRAPLPPGFTTVSVGAGSYRVDVARVGRNDVVTGVSLADAHHIEGLISLAEAVLGPIGLVGMFLGALVIGIKASGPVEQARLRQLEFTADASHELRTPLSVIEAEVDLALRGRRDVSSYRGSLGRVKDEAGRLRRIVEDLLWLARLDSTPPRRLDEPVDLAIVVEGCVDRFAPMAAKRDVTLRREREADGTSWLSASADELDRLVGVLVDNACRYTPEGGTVVVTVEHRGGRLHLVVEDSGPGIPAAQRPLLFDRFHRASDEPGGTGLGLAIADSVVRGTGGRWHVGNSSLGGARMEVSWHRAGREKPPVQGLHGSVRSPA